jgi:hypothetical protein
MGNVPSGSLRLIGKDVPLFHYAVADDDASHGTQFVQASGQWLDSMWSTIAYRYDG